MNGNYRVGDTVLGEWKLSKLLGQGSYGKVFEGEREDFGIVYKAAIKIITIPQSQSEIQSTRAEGMDDASITAYFRSMVEEMVQEFGIMSKLKGNSNIVSYEDHRVIPHSEGIGWDIIIRMECLRPMLDYMGGRVLEPREVAKVGVDMCKALELCAMQNIIHRDIKPENMFVNDLGDFKLGDFGIARTIERKVSNMSKKGTYTYMAPEIYKEEPYSALVDIYSLGIVLYRLLNNNRAPFLPLTGPITHGQREQALLRRISGAPLPQPCGDSGTLAQIVLKACAYRPEERWQTPTDMRQALERYLITGDVPVEAPVEEEEEEEGTVFAPRPPLRPRTETVEEGTVFSPPPRPVTPARPAPAPAPEEEDEGTVSALGYQASIPAAPARPAAQAPAPPAPVRPATQAPARPAPTPAAADEPVFISPSAVARPQTAAPAPASAPQAASPTTQTPAQTAAPESFAAPASPSAASKAETPAPKAETQKSQPTPAPVAPASFAAPATPAAPPTEREEPAPALAPEEPKRAERKKEPKQPRTSENPKKKTGLVIGILAAVLVIGAVLALWLGGVFTPAPAPTPTPAPTQVAATPAPTPSPSPTPNYVDDDWSDAPVYSGG